MQQPKKLPPAKPLKPRMALSLADDTRAAIAELAAAMGKPPATVVADLLNDMVPQLLDFAKFARAIQSGNLDAGKRALRHIFGNELARTMNELQPDMFKGSKRRKGK